MGICMIRKGDSVRDLTIEPELYDEIREKWKDDPRISKWRVVVDSTVESGIVSIGDKLYKDLKKTFWWPKMKKEVAEFVAICLVCQRVKGEHKRPQGVAVFDGDSVEDEYNILSSYECYHAIIGMTPFETLYGRKYRSPVCWDDRADAVVLGPEMIHEMVEQVQGMMRFGKRGKLSQKFIRPYKILGRVAEVAYRLALPPALDSVHNVRKTQNGETTLMKVLWTNYNVEEATWEAEAAMRDKYPNLFI
ncbi:uncharacterized protein LOC141588509 [Silene latifolia]|uniref:uncharacterized protein LOC141588509 n=1 Tax=Silene latifolia TaxID=37657 RepID=UPI003D77C21D